MADLPAPPGPGPSTPFLPSYAFDWEHGDFVVSPDGTIPTTSPDAAYRDWCMKALVTAWGQHLVYDYNFGLNRTVIGEAPTITERTQQAEAEITEALQVDPRTQLVSDFEGVTRGGELHLRFRVTPAEGRASFVQEIEV